MKTFSSYIKDGPSSKGHYLISLLFFLLFLLSCPSPSPNGPENGEVENDVPRGIATLDKNWLRGDLHSHTTHSDGYDGVATTFQVADSWRDPLWLSHNPEYTDDHLHFFAITDHRTVSGCYDPAFGHDYLIPICGKEWGGPIHACIWGLTEDIPHHPQGDETELERVADSIQEAHDQNALFSLAHPLDGRFWSVPVENFDAIEIWNSYWTLLHPDSTIEQLDAYLERWGVENEVIRKAVMHQGGGNNRQALRFWQAWLSLGVHVPPVGGSDRHFVFPAGMPTTFVRTHKHDVDGILDGIRSGETFVSRSPQGPQIILEASINGEIFPMGSKLPSGASEIEIRWHVFRAEGGILRLVKGIIDPDLPEPVETEIRIQSINEEGTYTWNPPSEGGWLHAIVVDPLPEPVPDYFEPARDALMSFPEGEAGDISGALFAILSDLSVVFDVDAILDHEKCDPRFWDDWMTWCMPHIEASPGSIFIPLNLQPYFSVEFKDREPTGYAMGAISAAFLIK